MSGPTHDRQSVFPATQYTWIEDRLAEGDTGLAAVRRHVMEVYAWPLSVYVKGSSFRTLGDADASALIGIAPCPTDKNGDSRTDLQDLLAVLARFSANACCAPVDDVAPSLSEIIDVLSAFGTECP